MSGNTLPGNKKPVSQIVQTNIMKKLLIYIYCSMVLFSCKEKPEAVQTEPNADPTSVTLTAAQVQQSGIETGKVTRQTLHAVLKVSGVVDVPPQNTVSVSFPMGGYLKTTHLLPGMHVRKGERIGVIEDQALIQLQQDYLMATARLQYLQKEYERQKTLNENKVNADKVLQQAEADYNSQKVLVKGLAEKLRLIAINPERLQESNISRSVPVYSPIDGFVSRVNVNIGRYINPTDVLFELINPADIHAALTVFEKDLPAIKVGQEVKVSFIDNPGDEYECEVILVTRNVDDNRSGIVHCHFEKIPKNLVPGMFLNGAIITDAQDALVVPAEALVRYSNTEYLVLAKGNNQYELAEVTTGIREKEQVQVQSSTLNLQDQLVVTKNAYSVLGKMKNTGDE